MKKIENVKKLGIILLIIFITCSMISPVFAKNTQKSSDTSKSSSPSSSPVKNLQGAGRAQGTTAVTTHTAEEIVSEADNFIQTGNKTKISEDNIKKMSDTVYNILLTVGIIIAFIVGGILGIKFVVGGIEEKAEIKNMFIPYIVGLVVLFGSFTIWKVVVTILQN